MAYTINNTDGSILLLLADSKVDSTTTSLDLVGRNVNGYGQYFNNDLVKLLANFAKDQPPRSPLLGQLWYNTALDRLQVYNSNDAFQSISGAIVASTQPSGLIEGDLWWDNTNHQLRIFANSTTTVVGPSFPLGIGDNGFVLPVPSVVNSAGTRKDVTLIKNYGVIKGMLSNVQFDLSHADSQAYFSTSTTATVVAGLTVSGDISASGKILNKHLSTAVDLNVIGARIGVGTDPYDHTKYQNQNALLAEMLEIMFPVEQNYEYLEPGLLAGSEARVQCAYSGSTNPNGANATQFRRFRVVNNNSVLSWQPYEIYSYNFDSLPNTLSNIINGNSGEIAHQ